MSDESITADELATMIAVHHPGLTRADCSTAAKALINQLHKAIEQGDRIGTISQSRDGTIYIDYLSVAPKDQPET